MLCSECALPLARALGVDKAAGAGTKSKPSFSGDTEREAPDFLLGSGLPSLGCARAGLYLDVMTQVDAANPVVWWSLELFLGAHRLVHLDTCGTHSS